MLRKKFKPKRQGLSLILVLFNVQDTATMAVNYTIPNAKVWTFVQYDKFSFAKISKGKK